MRRLMGFVVVLMVAVLAGCATTDEKPKTYTDLVRYEFEQAEEAYESGDYITAVRQYNAVSNKFPYSQYAALSELRVGDSYFEQEKYATAVEQYRNFIQLHPRHPKVVYAQWRVARAFYELMPEDWWFMPPAYERDLSKTRDAERELRIFVKRHPDAEYTKEARRLLAQTQRRLADHEFYAAKFYLRRDNYRAAVGRLTYLLKNYSGLGLDPQALMLLAKSYLELGDVDKARVALEDLVNVHPDSEFADDARQYLSEHNLGG